MKGSYQKRKEAREKATNCLWLIILVFITFYFSMMAIQNMSLLGNGKNTKCKIFTGEYNFEVIETWRNVVYRFNLYNGDSIDIPSEYLDNSALSYLREHNHKILTFKYSSIKTPLRNSYPGVSIDSIRDETSYLDESFTETMFQRNARVCLILAL